MVTIKWNQKAIRLFIGHISYARVEFGMTTAMRWFEQRRKIESQLRIHPESFTPEPLLGGKKRIYRGAILMSNFKIIYVYYPSSDTVRVVDIWDMRMNPQKLKKRL